MDPGQVQNGVDFADQVIPRNHLVEVELIEQVPLAPIRRPIITTPSPVELAKLNHDPLAAFNGLCNTIGTNRDLSVSAAGSACKGKADMTPTGFRVDL